MHPEVDPCSECPISQLRDLVIYIHEGLRTRALSLMEEEPPETKETFLMFGVAKNIFGTAQVSPETLWGTKKCVQAMWDFGKRFNNCKRHPLYSAFQKLGAEGCCLRKYILDETIKFIKGLWEKSGHNEEQFQALLRDGWIIHQGAIMC